MSEPPKHGPLMWTIWARNDATGEAAMFKGQGANPADATKEGWDNACADFGKGSSGEYISLARVAVTLPDGTKVLRSPVKFASRDPYDAKAEFKPAPEPPGDAALPYAQLVAEGKATWAPEKPKK